MLILTRKLGESINIGDNIKVSVLNISGLQVRIGVEAPPDVVVHREEIFNKIQEESKQASSSIETELKRTDSETSKKSDIKTDQKSDKGIK